jgi:hypothetical protein
MRSFSRWMPPTEVASRPLSTGARILLGVIALLGIGLFGWALTSVVGRWIAAGVILLTVVGNAVDRVRMRRLLQARRGEDIGTFARAFNRRAEPFDAWVVRAVWDAIQTHVYTAQEAVPLRPNDRFYQDLHIDPEDIELDVVPAAALRSKRYLDACERNPLYGKIETVGDVVRFLTLQPRRAAT